MHNQAHPTSFADVNALLDDLRGRINRVLGHHFGGMYVVGSLALGDFDPSSSDIDLIVLTDQDLTEAHIRGLDAMHAQVAAGSSPWATRLEVVYVPLAALGSLAPAGGLYPQIEKGTTLLQAALEPGWAFQCWTLRERGIVITGPDPRQLVAPIEPWAMAAAVAAIAGEWLDAARHDPTWLAWLRQRPNHTFVIQTLCRMLYSLAVGEVTSKPRALHWARHALGMPWTALIERADQQHAGQLTPDEIAPTVALIDYTLQHSRRSAR